MDKMKGVIFENDSDDITQNEAIAELDKLVKECLLILKLKGQDNPYCFDLNNDPYLRNLILAKMSEDNDPDLGN